MKYELMKGLGNKAVIVVMIMLFWLNGLEMFFHCKTIDYVYDKEQVYSTNDYQEYILYASDCIKKGQDVEASKILISEFMGREITNEYSDSMETEFVTYGKYITYGIIIIAVVVICTIDSERKSRMTEIVSITEARQTKVILSKQGAIAIYVFGINLVFLIENILICHFYGGIDLGLQLYNIPGFFATWFSGNVLSYKLISILGVCMIEIIVGNIIYIIAGYAKNIGALAGITVSSCALLYFWCGKIPLKYCFINLRSFFNCEELVKDFVLVNIGSGYTYRLWVALIYAAVVMMIVNVANYLIYRNRRAI